MAVYDTNRLTFGENTYKFVDLEARKEHNPTPLETKTYTNVIATSNDNKGAGFFYMKVNPSDYNTMWHIKVRVKASVPGNVYYNTDSIFDLWGIQNTYSSYESRNRIVSTSYRPFYYHSHFRTNSTGYNNGCRPWIGFNLYSSTNPTSASYKRTFVIDLLQYDECTVEMQDTLITPTNIPERADHTGWYTSTETSYDNFDACSQGLKQTGDTNTTTIRNLQMPQGNYITNSALYRYQMMFEIDENTLTPLNNDNNAPGTTKTMLTNVEFNPFGRILYYNSTTNISAGAAITGTNLTWELDFDLRYSFNFVNGDLTIHKPVYLKVIPTSNGKCKIASASPLTQTLPSTNDGYWYIFLGRMYSWYQLGMHSVHPVYWHDGTRLREVDATSANVELISGDNYRIIL